LTILIKKTIATELMNLINVTYIIDNFDQEISISEHFSAFVNLRESKEKSAPLW